MYYKNNFFATEVCIPPANIQPTLKPYLPQNLCFLLIQKVSVIQRCLLFDLTLTTDYI
jgi:hypothetical protein